MSRHHPVRLGVRHERLIYAGFATVLISGLLWLLFHHFVSVKTNFGDGHHPLEMWWMRLHGLAAMLTLILFGSLMPVHIRNAWQRARKRWTGGIMVSAITIMILTGYGLYYVASDETRPWISVIHWVIGILGVPALAIHTMQRGRRKPASPTSRNSINHQDLIG